MAKDYRVRMLPYYFEFELDGDTHVGRAHIPAGMIEDPRPGKNDARISGEQFGKEQVESMHPGMKLTVFRPLKNLDELATRAAELAMDPNHIPMTGKELSADAAQAILTPK